MRTRIRVSRKRKNREEMARLARALEEFPSVSRVDANLQTGTLLVYHEEGALEDIRCRLRDLGVILMAASGVELPTQWFTNAVSDLDMRISSQTKGLLNLKTLVPVGLGALAILQLVRRGLQLEGAPWYILAYFAFESFRRLNAPDEKTAQEELSIVE
jgi:hypothetical protein